MIARAAQRAHVIVTAARPLLAGLLVVAAATACDSAGALA